MPTYATAALATAILPGLVIDDADAFDRLLERCEIDIDGLLGPWAPRQDTGLKIDPETDLAPWLRTVLARAVTFQAEYILAHGGEQEFVTPAPSHVKGPDFEVWHETGDGGRPRYAPRALAELGRVRGALIPTGGRARV